GRRDHHPAGLPDVRVARPDQDGLPGAAQPHGPRRRRGQHPAQPRLRDGAGGPGAGRRPELRAAGPRRHPRGLPARRRADALAAAADAPRQLRGHLRGAGALPAGPDGGGQPHQLRPAQERAARHHPDPRRARGAAGGDPGHDARPDRVPGAGDGDRAEGRRVQPGAGRPAAPRDGQEEEGGAGRRVRAVLGRHAGRRLLRRGHQGPVGHPRPLLRLRVQQGPHRRLRAGVVLDGLPQGQLPGRVHGGAAHLGGRRQGQDGHLPVGVPADGHPGAAARRQRVGRQLHPRRDRHPLRPDGDPQRRRQRRRRHRHRARGARQGGELPRVPRPGATGRLQQAGHRVADQGRRLRVHGPHPAGADERLRGRGRRGPRPQAQRGPRPGRPVRRLGRRRRRERPGAVRHGPRPRRLGQAHQARVRAGHARPLRQRPPAAGTRAHPGRRARRGHRRAAGRRRSQGGHGHHRGDDHQRHPQDDQARGHLGGDHRRGPRGVGRGAAVPQGLRPRLHRAGHRRRGEGEGPAEARRRLGLGQRAGAHPARHHRRARRAGGHLAARRPVHPARRPAAAPGAGRAPGDDGGAAAAAVLREDDGDEAGRPAAGDAVAAPDGRPQGAAGSLVPRLL
ncbi:MAG: DNA polymerase III alpha subunit, partial [uncultured Friedmanniella sp.]